LAGGSGARRVAKNQKLRETARGEALAIGIAARDMADEYGASASLAPPSSNIKSNLA